MDAFLNLLKDLDLLGPFVGLALFSIAMFAWADMMLHPDIREKAKRWFMPLAEKPNVNVILAFNYLFEAVFTEKHWTRKCFVRSAAASTLLMLIFLGTQIPGALEYVTTPYDSVRYLILSIILVITTNIVADFLSLFQTRIFLRYLKSHQSLLWPVVALDFFLTYVIYSIVFVVFYVASTPSWVDAYSHNVAEYKVPAVLSLTAVLFDRETSQMVIILMSSSLITTFLTSIWLWLALIGGPIARALVFSRANVLTLFGRILDTEKRPFTSLGNVIALMLVVAGACVLLVDEGINLFL